MLLINRDTDYAVRVIIYMSKAAEKIISADEISDKLDIPYSFTRRILQTLSRKDILTTHRGRGGGFSLKKSPGRITVMDLLEIFQEDLDMTRCVFKDNICPDIDSCALRGEVKNIEGIVRERFSKLTIKDLI